MNTEVAVPRFPLHAVLLAASALTLLALGTLQGCKETATAPADPSPPGISSIETTGEEFLVAAVDELAAIAAWADPLSVRKAAPLGRIDVDSVYVYGQITPDGLGAVVTERHAYPKGILLITVRKSYGKNGHVVSETKRYISDETFRSNQPQQSSVTDVAATAGDTIVTHVVRNGTVETFTFRLPVVTRTTNQTDGTIRVTSRFASGGAVVSEIRDEGGTLIRRTRTTTLPSGAIQTRTEYADGSWRTVSTLGQADGSVLREITSGL
ncbi:MAG TPA: hypothetical protein VF889_06610 [Bacteroidota bacterium]